MKGKIITINNERIVLGGFLDHLVDFLVVSRRVGSGLETSWKRLASILEASWGVYTEFLRP